MNSALCLSFLQLFFIISDTATGSQPVKYYVLNSIADDRKLDKSTPVIFLRFHSNNSRLYCADPWIVYKKPTWGPSEKHSLIAEENSMQREKDILNGKVLCVARMKMRRYLLLPEICKDLERMGNFTIQYVMDCPSQRYFNETSKTWDGAMGLLQNGQADISEFFYSITSERREAVDISVTLRIGEICLFVKRPSKKVVFERSRYLQPFVIKVWCGMLLLLLVAMALLTFMKKKVEKELHCGRYMSKNFLQVWGILCQQGLSEFPSTSSHGIVFFSILCFGFITYSIYSSIFVTDIVTKPDGLPFSTMNEFVQNKIDKLMIRTYDPFYTDLKMNVYPYNILRENLVKHEDQPTSPESYKDMFCREKVASPALNVVLRQMMKDSFNYSVTRICIPWPRMALSLAFQKNSAAYSQALNYNILKLKEHGIMDYNYNRDFGYKVEEPEVIYTGLTVSDILPLLSILFGSFLLSLIVLCFEKLFWFYEKHETAVLSVGVRRPGAARIRNKHYL